MSKGAVRIETPTKVKNKTPSSLNKSPLRVPNAMETSSLGKKLSLIGTGGAPRFATPTRASRMAAEVLAKKKEESLNNVQPSINLISPSPTKSSSIKTKSFVNVSSPPPRRNKGTPTRKSSERQDTNESMSSITPTSKGTPKSGRGRKSAAISSSAPLSFMKSTASSRSSVRTVSNNSYAALASTSCAAEAAIYANSPAKKTMTPIRRSSQPTNHHKSVYNEVFSPMNDFAGLNQCPAVITPSPDQQPPTHDSMKFSDDGEKLSFDLEDLLSTMNMATQSLNKQQSKNTVKHATPTSSCLATAGNSSEDLNLSIEEGIQFMHDDSTTTAPLSVQPSPLRKKKVASSSPARKPWCPSSSTPKRRDIFNSSMSTPKKNTPIACDNDGSLSPISRKSTQLLNGNNRTPVRSPAPFAAKPTPYTASPASKRQTMTTHETPVPPMTGSDDLNSDVKALSDFTALPPRPPLAEHESHIHEEFDMFHETEVETDTPTSCQSQSPLRNTVNSSLSLGDFPSPQKTPHGFPIQAKPRFQILNPVMFALENDRSRDMNDTSINDQGLDQGAEEVKVEVVVKSLGGVFRPLSTNHEDYQVVSKTPSPPLLQSFGPSSPSNQTLPNTSTVGATSKTVASPFRYISTDPLATRTSGTLIRPVATPSPQTSPRESP